MIKFEIKNNTTLEVNDSVEGETIETKIERIVENNEPISDGAPLIWTDRKDGVLPAYDIRTDRFDLAIDAMNAVSKTHIAKREELHKEKEIDNNNTGRAQDNTSDGNVNIT